MIQFLKNNMLFKYRIKKNQQHENDKCTAIKNRNEVYPEQKEKQ